MNYFAHSPKDGVEAQPYAAHVRGVRELAIKFAREAGAFAVRDGLTLQHLIPGTAEYHDLGKLNGENQTVLSGQIYKKSLPVNHVDAGAAHFLRDECLSIASAAVIQAHHVGFPDFSAEMCKEELIFRDPQIASEVDGNLAYLEAIHAETIGSSHHAPLKESIEGDQSLFLRMFLSCLTDADHTDTSRNYGKYPATETPILLRAQERLAQLDKGMERIQDSSKPSERNILRSEMYQACRNADTAAGICSCDSPVGSGKTTAIMAHLLVQAQKRGLRRIFVVLPFTNIIRQSVTTYRDMLTLPGEDPKKVVAELHHRADFENLEARHLTALWRAPIIVTTAVAFFETLASNSPATLRRLHELPGSAIFVDESHAALPATLLPIAWRWMKILSAEWGCYWVLASGSMCRFWSIPEIAGDNPDFGVPEIVDNDLRNRLMAYEEGRITYLSDLYPKTTEELADWILRLSGPRLVILNTVQSAAVLADRIANSHGRGKVEHLSTALTPNDRETTLEHVKSRLQNGEDCDWTLVATSCVEAGMNLSFRNGFRELGSTSSLLQASGRVSREGEFAAAQMWTFCIAEDGMLKLNPGLKNAGAILREYLEDGTAIAPELTTKSISREIALYGMGTKHAQLDAREDLRDFKYVEEGFQVIESDTRLAIVDDDTERQVIAGTIDWQELQKRSIRVAKFKLDELGTPQIMRDIYRWNLEYDSFLGYMAGVVKLKRFGTQALIV